MAKFLLTFTLTGFRPAIDKSLFLTMEEICTELTTLILPNCNDCYCDNMRLAGYSPYYSSSSYITDLV